MNKKVTTIIRNRAAKEKRIFDQYIPTERCQKLNEALWGLLDSKKIDKQLTEALEKETGKTLDVPFDRYEKISSKGVEMENKPKCKDCFYVRSRTLDGGTDFEKTDFQCRFHPPQHRNGNVFPLVSEDTWCGKFKKDIPS